MILIAIMGAMAVSLPALPDGGNIPLTVQCTNCSSSSGGATGVNVLDGGILQQQIADLQASVSTSALQTTGNTSLSNIDGKTPALVSGRVPVDPSGVTSPISAATLPLPTNASTSALQTTGNTSLSNIDGKTPALVSGRVPVDPSGVTSPVSGTVTADRATVTSSAPVNITVTTSSTQLLAANATRRGYTCQAKGDNALQVNFREGTTAVTTDPELWPREAFTHDSGAIHTGVVAGIVSSGTAVVRCWEW